MNHARVRVQWPPPCSDRIIWDSHYVLPVSVCVWPGSGCVFGADGISVTNMDY